MYKLSNSLLPSSPLTPIPPHTHSRTNNAYLLHCKHSHSHTHTHTHTHMYTHTHTHTYTHAHTHTHTQFARHESISLLSQVVRAYPSHPRFTNMTDLTHKDPEVDFFENIKHIQQHRRTRALRRLAEVCAEGSLTQSSIMSFLLPLASQVGPRRRTTQHGQWPPHFLYHSVGIHKLQCFPQS